MARFSSLKQFSRVFNIDPDLLGRIGVLDPTLNTDTRLFIDPLLLEKSQHREMSEGARQRYRDYFSKIIQLLEASKERDDTYWRNAARLLRFPEIAGTCLGYGAESITGSGIGRGQRDHLVETAHDVVALGVKDPDLFVAMALFEEGIGADRIGDMTTNVILPNLLEFNVRILDRLDVPTEQFELGPGVVGQLPRNPTTIQRTPVILVPMDILRRLPIATDWDSAMSAASENDAIRSRVNAQIGEIWSEPRSRRSKAKLRGYALSSADNFKSVLEMLADIPATSYDPQRDPEGVLFWRHIASSIAEQFPLTLAPAQPTTEQEARAVIEKIISQFRFLIEERGLWTELYDSQSGEPRPESSAQKLFFAVSVSYCDANNLDITPEAETGNGPVDFKFALGRQVRIIVEVKLSTNSRAVHGYETQTTTYQKSEEARGAYFLLVDVGSMGTKAKRIFERRNAMALAGGTNLPQIEMVDGTPKRSASKR